MSTSRNTLNSAMFVRVLLGLALFATALSMTGGGLSLPPFKNLGWLLTPFRVDGIFGLCMRQADPYMSFTSMNPQWKLHQEIYCFNIFRPIDNLWNLAPALLSLTPVGRSTLASSFIELIS